MVVIKRSHSKYYIYFKADSYLVVNKDGLFYIDGLNLDVSVTTNTLAGALDLIFSLADRP